MEKPLNKAFDQVQQCQIEQEDIGQRIDNYLIKNLKGVPKSRIYRILRKGEVRVNKGRVKPEYRLQDGDLIRIPPVRVAERAEPSKAPQGMLQRLENAIVYEDKSLLIIDKPSGLAVHGGSGLSFGLIETLRQSRPDAPYLELVHRLDRDTSGCLLIAKKRSALRSLHEQLRNGTVVKEYLTLVAGRWNHPARVDAPLKKHQLQGGERMVRVHEDGKEARSRFYQVDSLRDATLMRVLLDTGRTHQIRVHAQHVGHPLAGDDKYGDRDFNQRMHKVGLRRLFLHAHRLVFLSSNSDQEIDISAPLPVELKSVIDGLNG